MAESVQGLTRLERAIARLPARQREAFLLRFMHGLEILEVASVLGRSPATIKRHLSRTHQRVLAKVPRADHRAAS